MTNTASEVFETKVAVMQETLNEQYKEAIKGILDHPDPDLAKKAKKINTINSLLLMALDLQKKVIDAERMHVKIFGEVSPRFAGFHESFLEIFEVEPDEDGK